jgi:hypothetical protein
MQRRLLGLKERNASTGYFFMPVDSWLSSQRLIKGYPTVAVGTELGFPGRTSSSSLWAIPIAGRWPRPLRTSRMRGLRQTFSKVISIEHS